jgi:hypothetical protein
MNMVVDPAMLRASIPGTSGRARFSADFRAAGAREPMAGGCTMPVTSCSRKSSYHGHQLGAHMHARLKVPARRTKRGGR